VRGISVRYAKPGRGEKLVETRCKLCKLFWIGGRSRKSRKGDNRQRSERYIYCAGVKKRAGKGERVEVDRGHRERKKVMHTT
jgi:hypothetical protein